MESGASASRKMKRKILGSAQMNSSKRNPRVPALMNVPSDNMQNSKKNQVSIPVAPKTTMNRKKKSMISKQEDNEEAQL